MAGSPRGVFGFLTPLSPLSCIGFRVIWTGYWPEFNLESVLIFVENIFIMKNLTDFHKRLEAGVDPRLDNVPVITIFLFLGS